MYNSGSISQIVQENDPAQSGSQTEPHGCHQRFLACLYSSDAERTPHIAELEEAKIYVHHHISNGFHHLSCWRCMHMNRHNGWVAVIISLNMR